MGIHSCRASRRHWNEDGALNELGYYRAGYRVRNLLLDGNSVYGGPIGETATVHTTANAPMVEQVTATYLPPVQDPRLRLCANWGNCYGDGSVSSEDQWLFVRTLCFQGNRNHWWLGTVPSERFRSRRQATTVYIVGSAGLLP